MPGTDPLAYQGQGFTEDVALISHRGPLGLAVDRLSAREAADLTWANEGSLRALNGEN